MDFKFFCSLTPPDRTLSPDASMALSHRSRYKSLARLRTPVLIYPNCKLPVSLPCWPTPIHVVLTQLRVLPETWCPAGPMEVTEKVADEKKNQPPSNFACVVFERLLSILLTVHSVLVLTGCPATLYPNLKFPWNWRE